MKSPVCDLTPAVFTTCRFRVDYDEMFVPEGCDGKPLPEAKDVYDASPHMNHDIPVPYEEYLRYYGNPDCHVGLVMHLERYCQHCGCWRVTQTLGGIDMMFDDRWQTGTFSVPDIFGGVLWPDDHLREVALQLLSDDGVTPPRVTHEVYLADNAT
jgi:hypothetical protein